MLNQSENIISKYFSSSFWELKNAISPPDMKKFAALKNNSERIDFILKYPEIYNLSLEVDNQVLKNSEKARQLKDLGNKYFGRGEFRKALELYSNAVLLAPQEESGVMLANRSATLYHLEQYNYALSDTEEAIRVGYPKELFYKVEERRARCLLALKRHGEAVQSFQSALRALDDAKLPSEKKQKLQADIRVMLVVMEKGNQAAKTNTKVAQKRQKHNETKKQIPKIQNFNPLFPACSKAVEIRDEGGDVGRHAVATKHIEPGEILVVEKPHCALPLAEYRLTHCHFCLSRIFAPIPAACNVCSCVAYCSIRCRNKDAKVHRNECVLLPTLWVSNTSITCFLALRTITQQPYEHLLKLKDKVEACKGKLYVSAEQPYRRQDIEAFCSLVSHEEERTTDDLLHRTYIALWLLRLLKKGPYFPEDVKTPDTAGTKLSESELYIGGLLLNSLMILQFNTHEISELTTSKNNKSLSKAKSMFIGGGLYPSVSLFNHSCNPGIIRYFIGTTMVVRAIRSISPGEEISENYGPIFTRTPEAERKKILKWQYWFDCECEACTEHWPLLDDIDPTILRFKCDSGLACKNVLPVNTNTNEFIIKCSKCGKNTNILKGLKALQDTDALFKMALKRLNEGNHADALETYLKILKLLDERLALPIKDYHICQQGARLCMLSLGNSAYI
ncbi:protein-lysine N-methyltransferase SMYD4 [Nomia melanderi]|uniref:protein-lysine N-methyltransferase SMYD4 n=1 Tax=Nomia melanderi TaxID=2448451 RepID=UPI003FCE568F